MRKTPSWPRNWANFSLLLLYSHRSAWANLHLLGQPNTCPARRGVLDRLIALKAGRRHAGRTIFLAGNHDLAFGAYLKCIDFSASLPSEQALESTRRPQHTPAPAPRANPHHPTPRPAPRVSTHAAAGAPEAPEGWMVI